MWEIYVGKPSKAEFSPLNKIADVLHDPLIFIPVLQMFLVQYNFPAFPLQKNVFTSNFFDLRCFPAAESKVCPTSQLCGKIFDHFFTCYHRPCQISQNHWPATWRMAAGEEVHCQEMLCASSSATFVTLNFHKLRF